MNPSILEADSSDDSPVKVSTPSTFASSSMSEMDCSLKAGLEPIAIVGMGCRLPGDVASPTDLWNLIIAKRVANVSKVPSTRFNIDAHYHQNNERPGGFNVPGGYFLDGDLQEFDPTMFDISPVEAAWMDPQQRKLLEVVYEAFESGGCTLDQVSAAVTGCFVGSFTSDFQQMALKEPDFRHSYATTGIDPSIIGNRISHVFNLRGPSVLLNTACSSSMYALHSACNSIRNRECDGAVVGGTNLILTVDQQMNTAKLGVLSPTNTCHTFDDSVDGYGRAEGVGALYIKSLDAALKNGDPIRAVIRSTATNCNGRVPDGGITYPSLHGQVDVISAAYKLGNLDPDLTSYIECHGTGTPLGDPIEVHAVSMAMRGGSKLKDPILIGSVKPNVGHSEAASSISTIIKAVLAIENKVIPPTTGVVVPNKKIKWDEWQVKVVTEPTSFSPSLPIRRVGVNAFGYGGTNGHAIIDNVESLIPDYQRHKHVRRLGTLSIDAPDRSQDRAHLLVFSAHDKATLQRNLDAYSNVGDKVDLLDLAYTLGTRRSKLSRRAFAVCRKQSYATDLKGASEIVIRSSEPTTVAFVFTGQGAQWPRMGAKLFQLYPSFVRTIQELDGYLAGLPDAPSWTIEASLLEPDTASRVNEAEFSQPLCTAIQVALVNLLDRWGVVPVATVGHSSGEIAAAYAAGYISAKEAIVAAYYRGKVVCSVNADGAMLAVGLGAVEVSPYIEKYNGKVVIACHNSPDSTTLSGDAGIIVELKAAFEAAKTFVRVVKTGGKAYHSDHMKDAARIYGSHLKNTAQMDTPKSKHALTCQMISSVTGLSMNETIPNSNYWTANLVSPVLFNQAIQKMMAMNSSINLVIEIGPHSALSGAIRQICLENNFTKVSYLPTLIRSEHDGIQLLKLAGNLWARDTSIDLSSITKVECLLPDGSFVEMEGKVLVDLPTYQWTYTKRLWLEPRQSREHRALKHGRHDILGRRVIGLSDVEPVWRNVLRHKELPWLKHHSLGGESVFPAAGYLAMAIEAITQMKSDSAARLHIFGYTLRDIAISAALVVPDDDDGIETMFSLRPSDRGSVISEHHISNQWYCFTVSSFSHGAWKVHMKGRIGINIRSRGRIPKDPAELPQHASYKSWNQRLRDLGFDFGPTFHGMTNIQTDGKTHAATSDMTIKQQCGIMNGESRYALHPACIDSCLQLFIVSIYAGRLGDVACGTVLTHFDEVSIWPPAPSQVDNYDAKVHAWTSKRGSRAFLSSAQLVAHDGELLADFVNVRCLSYEAAIPQQLHSSIRQDPYLQLEWKADVTYLESSRDVEILCKPSLGGLVDLLVHKNVALRILCFDPKFVPDILEIHPLLDITVATNSETTLQNLRSTYIEYNTIKFSQLDITAGLMKQEIVASYDLIILSKISTTQTHYLENSHRILAPGGSLLLAETIESEGFWHQALEQAGFSGIDYMFNDFQTGSSNILSTAVAEDPISFANIREPLTPSRSLLLIYREQPTLFLSLLAESCTKSGWSVRFSPLSTVNHRPGEQVMMLADLEGPVLATLEDGELKRIRHLTETASAIIWVTCGSLLSGLKPEYAMTLGFARVLRSEKQSLDLVTLDFDPSSSPDEKVMRVLMDIATRQAIQGRNGETEYCVGSGIVHVGRLVPSKIVNERFAAGQGHLTLVSLKDSPALKGVLLSGKVFFQNDVRTKKPLESNQVEIKVMAIGLNGEDSVVAGSDDSTSFNHEVAGVITAVGSDISHVNLGDRVTGFAFDTFATHQRTLAKLVQPIADSDPFQTMATLPSAFATALYGLDELARIQSGEIVLILDESGPAGLAAIQLCEIAKAKAVIITSSQDTIALLRISGFSADQIIIPGKEDITIQIQRVTAGQGADIVFCSGSADPSISYECCKNMAPFSRFVTFGRKDLSLPSPLDFPSNAQGYSLFTFDLRDLYEKKPNILAKLLEKCMQLYNDRKISTIQPLIIRGASEINEAITSISNKLGAGKVVVPYEPTSLFRVLPTRAPLQFHSEATYLLVGCLGGLGRSLVSWMIDGGAKHFAFISRSGADNPSAAALVESIRALGVEALVLRADVTSRTQIEAAIRDTDTRYPIRGVVNAAMVLHDGFFQSMNIDDWRRVINPKLKGSLNLHEVFSEGQALDFFVMTSSIAATIGSAGQSNYAAANSFLDALARHRRAHGLPGVSLILPMVLGIGYIAEHPEIEDSVRRKGMYGIGETEMLAAFEVSMTPQPSPLTAVDHLVVGLEPSQLAKSVNSTNADVFWLEEPRFRTIATAMRPYLGEGSAAMDDTIIAVVESAKSAAEAVEAVTAYLVQRLSRLLMIDAEDFQPESRSIASYGLDSMIGAELRNWVFREFKVDVPFQQLLAGNLTVAKFATDLCAKLGKVL